MKNLNRLNIDGLYNNSNFVKKFVIIIVAGGTMEFLILIHFWRYNISFTYRFRGVKGILRGKGQAVVGVIS